MNRSVTNSKPNKVLLATDGPSEFSLIREFCDRPICAQV